VSTQSVMPAGIVIGPVTRALFVPLAASLTACPDGQALSAAWIALVSKAVSLGTAPLATFCVASTVAHAVGILGSAGKFVSPAPQVPVFAPPVALVVPPEVAPPAALVLPPAAAPPVALVVPPEVAPPAALVLPPAADVVPPATNPPVALAELAEVPPVATCPPVAVPVWIDVPPEAIPPTLTLPPAALPVDVVLLPPTLTAVPPAVDVTPPVDASPPVVVVPDGDEPEQAKVEMRIAGPMSCVFRGARRKIIVCSSGKRACFVSASRATARSERLVSVEQWREAN
jgi:hypothetical protein